ncbi:MAG: methyltransferase, TIGR04325 family [Brevundimonas sp.]|uniref:methyltransferase, TIGR04325 family n=1 Tax=Brevundimonas sp. TaxID=1871086 RepID=UPI00391B1904
MSREPIFASYDDAVRSRGQDYHDQELADVVLNKTRKLVKESSFEHIADHHAIATLLAVTTASAVSKNSKTLRVLDFGGALGTSYHLVKERLPGNYAWAVVETPTFVKAGREFETNELRMFESIQDATSWLGEIDLLYTSSAVQYMPDPLETIDQFLAVNPRCVALLRSAFSEREQIVVLQRSRLQDNGPGPLPVGVQDRPVYYPRTYAPVAALKERFKSRYRPVVEYGDGSPAGYVGGERVELGRNYLFARLT